MQQKDISISNVVKLVAACNFLEMDSLASRAFKFLEKSVFVSSESCLSVIATFGYDDPHNVNEDPLFRKCRRAFLGTIGFRFQDPAGSTTMACNVHYLLRAAEVLSPKIAELIYHYCRAQRFGLFFLGDEETPRPWFPIPLCTHVRKDLDSAAEGTVDVKFYSAAADGNHGVQWMESLLAHSLSLSRMTGFISHTVKSVQMENDGKFPTPHICLSQLRWSFLCVLLEGAEEWIPRKLGETAIIAEDLDAEILNLKKMISRGLGQRSFWSSAKEYSSLGYTDVGSFVLRHINRFHYETLRQILRNFNILGPDLLTISRLAKVVDEYVSRIHPKSALLIYKEFPNDARSSHKGIYEAFEYHLGLEKNELHPEDILELSKLLDSDKLPAKMASKCSEDMVKNIFKDRHKDCDTRILQGFMSKMADDMAKLRKKLNLQTADLIKLRNEFSVQNKDLARVTDDKFLADLDLRMVRRQLAEEKKKRMCPICFKQQICFEEEDESLFCFKYKEERMCPICFNGPHVLCRSLLCMHRLLYCSGCLQLHHQDSTECRICMLERIGRKMTRMHGRENEIVPNLWSPGLL